MSFLGGITGGGVDWDIQLADDAARGVLPGATLRGTARATAHRDIDARAVVAGLIGTAEWKVSSSRRDPNGAVVNDTTWKSDDLGRVEARLAGPTRLANGETIELPFELALPLSAPPSFDSNVLRVKWELEVKLDVGGMDPSADLPVRVLLPVSQVRANAAGLGLNALAPRVDGNGGDTFAIEVEPVPLVAGRPFRGVVESRDALKDARIEIKFAADVRDTGIDVFGTIGRDTLGLSQEKGQSETRTAWVGALREAGSAADGRRRYEFAGDVPPDTSPTVVLPYGEGLATLDVVVHKRFMPDGHLTRDVAIATAED
jgi:hypothetical protein